MSNFHWTFHTFNVTAAIYPICYLLYNNIHNSSVYQRYFLKRSSLNITDDLLQMLENEISEVSSSRVRPIRNAKLAVILEDKLSSETIGSFGFNNGALFKFCSRVALRNIEELKRTFKNFNSIIDYKEPFIDIRNIPDTDLQKIILSEKAIKFLMNREIRVADSTGQTLVPACISIAMFTIGLSFLSPLRKLIGSVPSLCFSLIFSVSLTYFAVNFYQSSQILYFDKLVFMTNDDYLSGCKEYLLKSQQLGKLLRSVNGPESKIGKKFSENGDCLLQKVKYSKRLAALKSRKDI